MSDIACRFYEIMYGKILEGNKVIGSNGDFWHEDFAGDTMCSFNSVANSVSEAGKSRKQRTNYEQWPSYLQEYYDMYQCLANFWMIPKELGRKSNKSCCNSQNIEDYVDRFLGSLVINFQDYSDKFNRYFTEIPTFEEFTTLHKLEGSYVYLDSEIYNYSNKKRTPEEIIDSMKDRIRLRASLIATSEFMEELWCFFAEYDLIKRESM